MKQSGTMKDNMGSTVEGNALVSIVVPSYNEQDNVGVLFDKIRQILDGWGFEVVYVDDGSSDDTIHRLRELAQRHKEVSFVSFSRNFGHQAALRAGLRAAKGDVVISMDADLQHPPEMLPQLLDKWQKGYDIVYTVRRDTSETSAFKRMTSRNFYKVMNFLSELHLEEGAADFRLLDRRVVDIINSQQESDLFLRGYVNWLGFRQIGIPYMPAKRFSGQSKYTFRKMFKLASQGMTQFSVKPLQLSIVVGLILAILGLFYGLYALVGHFAFHDTASGWTSLTVVVLVTSGVQLMLLGVVGEYVGKIFLQTKQRPDYVIREHYANNNTTSRRK